MSQNPFVADPAIRLRQEQLAASVGSAIEGEITRLVMGRKHDPALNEGAVLLKQEAAQLIARYGLSDIEELMLLALGAAKSLARPPISQFFVGAVGLELETGNLILGGNLEFPGAHLGFTVHGEGFVFTRAFSRGTSIPRIAIGEAHPCAHCRQYLSEFAATRDLLLIDPLGHRLSMAELYPWPFDPDYLGEAGLVTGVVPRPDLALGANTLDAGVAEALLGAGRRAHAPYSKCPAAVVLTLRDGGLIAGAAIESVAFNPTMGPLQAALIDLVAHGYEASDIAAATLGTVLGGAVDYAVSTAELLGKVAPGVPLTILEWV
jgi:cytidine deaminase